MNVGLYGGSFDPIHNAHLIIAQYVMGELPLDKILFIPSGTPPHKDVFASPEDRLAMLKAAIKDNPKFECSEIEAWNSDMSFSVDTIETLKKDYSDDDLLFWIMGSDNFVDFDKWKNPERIKKMCTLLIFPRRNIALPIDTTQEADDIRVLVDAPVIDISSTMIRQRVLAGKSIRYLVPESVEHYLLRNKIYAHNSRS